MHCSSLITKTLFVAAVFFTVFDAQSMDSKELKRKQNQKYSKQNSVKSKTGCLFEMYGADQPHYIDGRIYRAYAATLLPDGDVAVAVKDPLGRSLVKIVDPETASERGEFAIPSEHGFVYSMTLLQNKNLVMMTSDKFLLVYDVESKRFRSFLDKEITSNSMVLQLEDGNIALISGRSSVKIFDLQAAENEITIISELYSPCGDCTAALQLANGNIVSGTNQGSIHIFDYETGDNIIDRYDKHESPVFKLFKLDNDKFISVSEDAVIIWSAVSGAPQSGVQFAEKNDLFDAFCVGSQLILVKNCGQIHIRDAQSFDYLTTLGEKHEEITSTFRFQNGIFATRSKDSTIKLWDPQSYLSSVKILNGCKGRHFQSSLFETFSGNLVSVEQNGCLRIWRTNDIEPKII